MLATASRCNFAFQALHSPFFPQLHGNHFPFCSFVVLPPSAMSRIPCWQESSEELLKSIVLSITSSSSDVEGDTLCSVTQGKGRKIKGLLVGTYGSPWTRCREEGCCSAGSFIPWRMKCHLQEQFCEVMCLCPFAWEAACPSDLN